MRSAAECMDLRDAAGRVFSSISAAIPSLSVLLFTHTCEFRLFLAGSPLIPQAEWGGAGGEEGRGGGLCRVSRCPERTGQENLLRTCTETKDRKEKLKTTAHCCRGLLWEAKQERCPTEFWERVWESGGEGGVRRLLTLGHATADAEFVRMLPGWPPDRTVPLPTGEYGGYL